MGTNQLESHFQDIYNLNMSTITYLDRFLDPLTDAFSPEVARRVLELKASTEIQARAEHLAEKSESGTLSPEEVLEYRSFIEAVDIVSVIQAKARRFLARHGS